MPVAGTRIFQPKDILLFRAPPGTIGVNAAQIVFFTIPTPSARVAAKIALIWWQQLTGQSGNAGTVGSPPNNNVDSGVNASIGPMKLNLFSYELAETGIVSPTVDLVGALQLFAPQNVPIDAASGVQSGLAGFSTDVQGGQQGVGGMLWPGATTGYTTRLGINVSLRVKYELVGSEMCQDEWDSLKALMVPFAPTPVVFV